MLREQNVTDALLFVRTDNVKTVYPPTNTVCGGYNNVYEMKAGSFIDESAEFQTNWLMDIKYAEHLVRMVPGSRGPL